MAPALIVAPPARLTFSVPLVTVSCAVARLPSDVVDREAGDREHAVLVDRLRAGHGVDRPVVHGIDGDRHGVGIGRAVRVGRKHRQRIRAIEVGVALVGEARERGVDLRLRAGERQGRTTVRARADRGAAGEADRQRSVGDGEARGGQVAVDVVDRDAGDREHVSSLTVCAPGTVFTGPSFTELTVIAIASESVAPFASVDSNGERIRTVEVGVALVREGSERGVDLRLGAGQRQRRAAVRAGADRRAAGEADVQRAVGDGELRGGKVAVDVVHRDAGDRSAVSSLTVCAPGTVFTGPSFTELTVIATASESVAPLASVESTVSVSAPLKSALPW